ncbi:hypothetical protein BKA70DRAFT_1379599 [Coprinopsis sp. MPI-PUGE-AT-0042]|nr:hypothetical protein BKA70DRAFT_1379599 [Coprinopsis sp. MPI-PUGE-AT-0042]
MGPKRELEQSHEGANPSLFFGRCKTCKMECDQYTQTRIKLQDWIPRRQSFLYELLRHDGLGDSMGPSNVLRLPPYRTRRGYLQVVSTAGDVSLLRCKHCVLLNHAKHPLHRVELGHGGGPCEHPVAGPASLLVFHTTGVHRVSIDYCDCRTVDRLSQLMRSSLLNEGREGQDPAGIDATTGELAQECPACPHPGKNLPDGWKDAGARLTVASPTSNDPWLVPTGVNEHKYQEYLIKFAHEEEVSRRLCPQPDYLTGDTQINTCLVICSRHGLVRANGIGDLQKGETYANMTYIFFAAVMAVALLRIVITYDIACQWSKNLYSRMETLPEELNKATTDCQANFALGYREGNGRTCGDEIEGTWDHTNSLGTSVREMAPGARHETLNDHFGGYNFHKIVGLRHNLLKKMKEAHKMQAKHLQNHALFTSTFKEETIDEWTADIEAWNADNRKPNPYEDKPLNITLHDVRLELLQQDAEDAKKGAVIISDISPSSCLVTGLDLEETQRLLVHEQEALGEKATAKERADFHDKVMSWNRRVQTWREVQSKHLPCAAQLLPVEPAADPKIVQLVLPSSLSPTLRSTVPKMAEIERKLRIAQCDDALAEIRRQRLSGQGNKPNTRLRGIYNRMNAKTDRLADRYRAAYKALLALETDTKATWRSCLKFLAPKDVSGPGKEADESSGQYQPSWIWLEEMRRVVAYLTWKADWWDSKASLHVGTSLDGSILSGVGAYAWKQASLLRQLAEASIAYWKAPLTTMGISIEWATTSIEADPCGSDVGRQYGDPGTFVDPDSADEDESDDDRDVALELDACVFDNDI